MWIIKKTGLIKYVPLSLVAEVENIQRSFQIPKEVDAMRKCAEMIKESMTRRKK